MMAQRVSDLRGRADAVVAQMPATSSAPAESKEPDTIILVNGTSIKPVAIRWLWLHWLALGKLHILAGAPGQGKTSIALAAIATLTSGGRWPDGTRCEAGNALIWSGEDDFSDTLMPRLIAMGADVSRVYFVKGARISGEVLPFDPARDMVQLTEAALKIGNVKLLLVDPVVSAVAGDSHKNTEVRRALQPLVDLASHLDAAVLGISHFSKGGAGKDPTERVVGSVAFSAVARVVLCAAKVKGDDGEDRRVLVRSKSNIGPDDGGFEYALDQIELDAHPGVFASRVTWGQSVVGSARELLAEARGDDASSEETSALDDAVEFLRSELSHGPQPSKMIFGQAREAGHAERTLKRAKAHLQIEARKEGKSWVWGMPPNSAKEAKGANNSTSENLGPLGPLDTLEDDGEVF